MRPLAGPCEFRPHPGSPSMQYSKGGTAASRPYRTTRFGIRNFGGLLPYPGTPLSPTRLEHDHRARFAEPSQKPRLLTASQYRAEPMPSTARKQRPAAPISPRGRKSVKTATIGVRLSGARPGFVPFVSSGNPTFGSGQRGVLRPAWTEPWRRALARDPAPPGVTHSPSRPPPPENGSGAYSDHGHRFQAHGP